MTDMRPEPDRQPELSPTVRRAIQAIEPPEAEPDFWDRLDRSVAGDLVKPGSVSPIVSRPRPGSRVAVLAAAAALLVLGAAAAWQLRGSQSPSGVVTGPADERGGAETTNVGEDDEPPLTVTVESTEPSPTDGPVQQLETAADADSSTTAPTASTDGEDTSGSTVNGGTAVIRIEAESMAVRTVGDAAADGWNLWSAGYLEDIVALPTAGRYRITVRARGFSTTETEPEMEVRVGGVEIGSTAVAVDRYRDHVFEAVLEQGSTPLRLSFTNDPNRPDNDVDLTVDRVELELLE